MFLLTSTKRTISAKDIQCQCQFGRKRYQPVWGWHISNMT